MPFKLMLSLAGMVAMAVLILSLAIGGENQPVTGTANKLVSVDIPSDMTLNRFSDAVPVSCQNSNELLAIEHTFDTTRLSQLNAAMQTLHNKTGDPFWQPLVDLFKPKSIWLNPTDFSVGYSENAVEVNRQVKRIVVNYPNGTDNNIIKLSYDLQMPESGTITVIANKLSEKQSLGIPVDFIKSNAYLSADRTLLGGEVSDCVVTVLPLLLPELSWHTAAITDQLYCQLQGLHNTKSVINFYVNCQTSLF
ncbi:hypothetical protein WG68_18285 [Arsukibacterium ikkense]|uniref:Uncharacterized protein n=1 Tax=Arsukibacterium ikkense TaxID=336831 RepID=A0A0M2V3Z5_9GAMM|nr:hypothetical protein [Arsukibacterium ikkense]KKO43888.1 hypothetical protein WG68_18285 [Arsukibacterium ikkense]